MEKLVKIWNWIKANAKWILLILLFILMTIPFILLAVKSSKIKRLETELRILLAKAELEKLSVKYESNIEKLKDLRKKDDELNIKLNSIEADLKTTMEYSEVSAEEIVQRFKELGL